MGKGALLLKTLVVIPTYNEAETISATLNQILDLHSDFFILVVDDNSPDRTADLVRNHFGKIERIELLQRRAKEGLGVAYLDGFAWAFARGFERIVQMDADGSHRPSDLQTLVSASVRADLVLGSRWISGGEVLNWPTLRMSISRIGNRYARVMLGTSIADMTSGYRVYRAEFLKQLVSTHVSSHGYSFQVELAYRASKSGEVVEVPITFIERVNGKSKMTLAIVLEALTKVTLWGLKRVFAN